MKNRTVRTSRTARTARYATAALAATAGLAGLAPGATADEQVLTATVSDSIVASVSHRNVEFGKLSIGTNTVSGEKAGRLKVQSNVPYTTTVLAAKAAMTKYHNGAYDDLVFLPPLAMTTSSGESNAIPVTTPAAISNTVPAMVASGTGLTGNDHDYDLTFVQTVTPGAAKTTYRNVLTYTTSATL